MALTLIANLDPGLQCRNTLNAVIDLVGANHPWTSGSIPFTNPSGDYAQDNTNLWWDATNFDLHIGGKIYAQGAPIAGILNGSGVPSSGLGALGDYYVDEDGDVMYGPKAISGSVGPEQIAIPPSASPGTSATANYELGCRFAVAVDGTIIAVRYYRAASSSQIAHTVKVWDLGGTLLSSEAIANDGGGSGWIQVDLTTPVSVLASDVVVVSTDFTSVHARTNSPGFPISNGGDVSITTGVYYPPSGSFPSLADNTNFFVDAVFEATLIPAPYWPIAVGPLIGQPVGASSPGSILFVDSGLNLAQDSANFFWDDANNDLHIGGKYYIAATRALYYVPGTPENNWFEGNSGSASVTGYGNFGTGDLALASVTSGYNNVAMGSSAARLLTDGFQNISIGSFSLNQTSSDRYNVAIGMGAMEHLGYLGVGGGFNQLNIAIGFAALNQAEQADENVVLGANAVSYIAPPATASRNVIIGAQAGASIGFTASGNVRANTFIGFGAARNIIGTSSFNTWIGGHQGPASVLNNTIAFSDGEAAARTLFDKGVTNASAWSMMLQHTAR